MHHNTDIIMTYDNLWRRLGAIYEAGEAKAIVRTLLEEKYGLSLADILCGGVEQMSAERLAMLGEDTERLMKAEPLQYVLGFEWFCCHRFGVAPGVLIPRPETEWLVGRAVEIAGGTTSGQRILDIGTGSGCIATSIWLATHEKEADAEDKRTGGSATVEAWDISPEALAIAEANARALGADVSFRRRDALKAEFCHDERPWDIIVSNPPYICLSERRDMSDNVLDYEPHTALFVPDDDPLLFYRSIAAYALQSLRRGGTLLFECNTAYAGDTREMLEKTGFDGVALVDDCFGKPRFVEARRG